VSDAFNSLGQARLNHVGADTGGKSEPEDNHYPRLLEVSKNGIFNEKTLVCTERALATLF